MHLHKLTAVIGACCFLSLGASADTLTFVAQPVSGGAVDYSWFNAANWFTSDGTGNLVPAGRVPSANEQVIIQGAADLGMGGVRVQNLVETNNATLTNGTLAVENLLLLSGSTLGSAIVNVLAELNVGGTNCTFQNATVTLFGIASGNLQPLPPATAASLVLTQGSSLQIGGFLNLSDGSQISGGGLPQSKLAIASTGGLSSTNSTAIRGSANGHLIIDNSGVVRVNGGTLTFSDGIDWQSSGGTGEFRADASTALILFSNVFHADSTITSLFTGSGTNRWLAGATIDGVAQVSAPSPSTQLAGPGNLEIFGPVTGAGTVHALGTTNQGGVATWSNGTLGLPGLQVDPGANLVIAGGTGESQQLNACVITNLGTCTLLSGQVAFSQGAAFNNQTGATFVVQGQGEFSSSDGSGVFNNSGTVQVVGAGALQFGDTNSTPGHVLSNNGLLDLQSGQLELSGGAASGEFRQAPGTLLWFWGNTYALNTGTTFTGSNTVRVAQGAAPAKWLVNDSIAVSSLELGANGILDASGVPVQKSIQIGNLLMHDNGSLSNGTFQVQSFEMLDQSSVALSSMNVGSTLTVSGTNCTLAATMLTLPPGGSGLLQSAGTGAGTTLNLAQGSIFQDGGRLTIADSSSIANIGLPPSQLIIAPGGVLESTNSASMGGLSRIGADFNNEGNLEVKSGTLVFQGSWQQTQGTTTIDGGAVLVGTNLSLQGGTISGTGTIDANLANTGGVVSPGITVGILSTGAANDYQQGALGTLAIELSGTAPGSQYDQFVIGGTAQLDGELQLQFLNGFAPVAGETFQVLTCRSESGKFASINVPPVAGGVWLTRYNGTNVSLTLVGSVQLSPRSRAAR